MNSFQRISTLGVSSPKDDKEKKLSYKCVGLSVYMFLTSFILIPMCGLTIALFIIEINFVNNVTPFINTFKQPDFNMTQIIPTITLFSNIVMNACNNPEFKQLCE